MSRWEGGGRGGGHIKVARFRSARHLAIDAPLLIPPHTAVSEFRDWRRTQVD